MVFFLFFSFFIFSLSARFREIRDGIFFFQYPRVSAKSAREAASDFGVGQSAMTFELSVSARVREIRDESCGNKFHRPAVFR